MSMRMSMHLSKKNWDRYTLDGAEITQALKALSVKIDFLQNQQERLTVLVENYQ